jgi:hypothetical protein
LTLDDRHLMVSTDSNGELSLFECSVDGCGRRLLLDHHRGRLTVLASGAPGALHQGSTGVVALEGTVEPGLREAS